MAALTCSLEDGLVQDLKPIYSKRCEGGSRAAPTGGSVRFAGPLLPRTIPAWELR
jgi:hypothetical protein